ncbi:MAG: multiheme c-type cytochrome [Janthinobacterium lividum]
MITSRKYLYLIIFCVPLAFIFSQCFNLEKKQDPRGSAFAGSASCIKCHRNLYNSYLTTAHYKASQTASVRTVHGSFHPDSNTFFIDKNLKIVLEKHNNGFFQTAYANGKITNSQRFDIVFGGIKGETYVYWKGDQLFQLPLSYFNRLKIWGTSPGYDASQVDYSRAIGTRCFECHSSFINENLQQTKNLHQAESFDKSSLILSIDCERCHGPLANHVEFQTANPDQKTAKFVAQYQSLSRAQKLDACAVCHSGNKSTMLKSTFGFKPGNLLANFKLPDLNEGVASTSNLDVHGNQMQLLASSKCFVMSKMDCSSCHNTHNNERGNEMLFAQRCMNCHKTADHNFCKKAGSITANALRMNCVKCHMPEKNSTAITVQTSVKAVAVPFSVTTHRIAVYPQESAKIMAYLKDTNKRSINND